MALPFAHIAYLEVEGFSQVRPVTLHAHNGNVELFRSAIDLMPTKTYTPI